ncbi:MAG: hypothetical protein JO297_07745 [Nitrososphaeraceae archaeon]|nr:hypothetical protein [Nitrososphaeraceae archaeon]
MQYQQNRDATYLTYCVYLRANLVLASKVKRTLKEEGRGRRKSVNLAIISANNHYVLWFFWVKQ